MQLVTTFIGTYTLLFRISRRAATQMYWLLNTTNYYYSFEFFFHYLYIIKRIKRTKEDFIHYGRLVNFIPELKLIISLGSHLGENDGHIQDGCQIY